MLIIAAAAHFEAESTLQALAQKGIPHDFFEIGIGPLAASRNAERMRGLVENNHVIFIGTCGTFTRFVKPEIVTVKEVRWQPTCERIGASKRVSGIDMPIRLQQPLPELKILPQKMVFDLPSSFPDRSHRLPRARTALSRPCRKHGALSMYAKSTQGGSIRHPFSNHKSSRPYRKR